MKRIIYVSTILLVLVLNYACTSNLPDEQFEKNVLLTKNGWIDQSIEFTDSGIVKIPFVASINGTSTNQENVDVTVDFAPDTLTNYNFEKYREQPTLYYKEVPNDAVSFVNSIINVPKGEDRGVSALLLDLNKITDKYADYVIPIQIKSASKYTLGSSMYTKALYHLQFKNSFSGTYSGEINVYKTKGTAAINDEDNKLTISSKILYAISDKECYFYAGQMDRSKTERDSFIVNITLNDKDSVIMTSPNSNLRFESEGATRTVTRTVNSTDQRYEIVNTTLYMQYTFYDLTLQTPIKLRAQGSVLMSQNVLK